MECSELFPGEVQNGLAQPEADYARGRFEFSLLPVRATTTRKGF
jgi:hypothetical protein